MSDFLGNIGHLFSTGFGDISKFFGSPAGKGLGEAAGLGATGAGLIGNLLNDQQRAAAEAQARRNMNLTPAQLGAQVAGATQPLNAALVQAVTGNVNANLAEQGLSQAPGLIATATSQALAPFQQQNQQTALNLVMQRLGLPQAYASTIPPNANLAPLLAMLMKGFGTNPASAQWPIPHPPISDTTGTYDYGGLIPPQPPVSSPDFGSFPWPSPGPAAPDTGTSDTMG